MSPIASASMPVADDPLPMAVAFAPWASDASPIARL
jgi:hypothetical protein